MSSPFLAAPPERWIASNGLAFALRDNFPVSPGHTLVVPKRMVATWFDATREEQVAMLELIDVVKARLDAELHPDGYNIGLNAGAAAGQTVMHLHVHVIPRYHGDVEDPRGGVRHVMPGKGNYLAAEAKLVSRGGLPRPPGSASAVVTRPSAPIRPDALVTGGTGDPFLAALRPWFARATDVAILVAFAQPKGVLALEPLVQAALAAGARLRLVTGDYLGVTHPSALDLLLGWTARTPERGPPPEVRVVEAARLATAAKSFHPKSWLLVGHDFGVAFVGSSNLSHAALGDGIE